MAHEHQLHEIVQSSLPGSQYISGIEGVSRGFGITVRHISAEERLAQVDLIVRPGHYLVFPNVRGIYKMRPAAWIRCEWQCARQFQRCRIEAESRRELAIGKVGSQGGRDLAGTSGEITGLHGCGRHKGVRLDLRETRLGALVTAEEKQPVFDDPAAQDSAELVAF